MKKYFLIGLLGFTVLACQSESKSEGDAAAGTEATAEKADNEEAGDQKELPRIQPKDADIAAKVPDGATSVLAGLSDMAYDEAYEIDDFRARLEYDMGDVNKVMMEASGVFEDRDGMLVAEAQMDDGNVISVILVADPTNDVLHGASHNAEIGAVDYYSDREGAEKPAAIEEWAAKF